MTAERLIAAIAAGLWAAALIHQLQRCLAATRKGPRRTWPHVRSAEDCQ